MKRNSSDKDKKVVRNYAIEGNLAKKIKIEALEQDCTQSKLFENVILDQFEKIYAERKRKYDEEVKRREMEERKKFKVVSERRSRKRINYKRKQINTWIDVDLIKKWEEVKKVYGSNMTYYVETLIRNDLDKNFNEYKRLSNV